MSSYLQIIYRTYHLIAISIYIMITCLAMNNYRASIVIPESLYKDIISYAEKHRDKNQYFVNLSLILRELIRKGLADKEV